MEKWRCKYTTDTGVGLGRVEVIWTGNCWASKFGAKGGADPGKGLGDTGERSVNGEEGERVKHGPDDTFCHPKEGGRGDCRRVEYLLNWVRHKEHLRSGFAHENTMEDKTFELG